MSLRNVLELSAATLASLGGGGAIVYTLSGFLGKLWAERALNEQRQKYTELNLRMQSQLDTAARRLQVELDALGLVHKLRTQEEFSRLAGLWKRVANLQMHFEAIAGMGPTLKPADKDARERFDLENRKKYQAALADAQVYLQEEMLFIPQQIAEVAQKAIADAAREEFTYVAFGAQAVQYMEARTRFFSEFNEATDRLEGLMREHINGRQAKEPSSHPTAGTTG